MKDMKQTYVEPATTVEEVTLEGFICASIRQQPFQVEVDELVSVEEETIYL